MIELESRGDAMWNKQFETPEDAYAYLWHLVGRHYAYHIYHRKNAKRVESGPERSETIDDLLSAGFDIEDDLIIWREKGKPNKYCAGWHHSRVSGRPEIIMPDGSDLYSLFEAVGELRFDEEE